MLNWGIGRFKPGEGHRDFKTSNFAKIRFQLYSQPTVVWRQLQLLQQVVSPPAHLILGRRSRRGL